MTVTAVVEAKGPNGVIVAQGGNARGWALYLENRKLVFSVHHRGKPTRVVAPEALPSRAVKAARMTANPDEPLRVGLDTRTSAAEYEPPLEFNGTIRNVEIKLTD